MTKKKDGEGVHWGSRLEVQKGPLEELEAGLPDSLAIAFSTAPPPGPPAPAPPEPPSTLSSGRPLFPGRPRKLISQHILASQSPSLRLPGGW